MPVNIFRSIGSVSMSNTMCFPSHFSSQSLDLVSELHSVVLLVFMMVKMCLFSEWFGCYTIYFAYTFSNPPINLWGRSPSHFMSGMLRDVRYFPKVTELTGGMMGLLSRAASFQSSHCLHYLVGTGQTGQAACKTSPGKVWPFSSPPANSTICAGAQMEISEHLVLQNSSS